MLVTLKTLPQATAQQVFDQVVVHMRTQKVQALKSDGDCAYRAGTLKCAAGCLIADDEYTRDMDGMGQTESGENLGSNWYGLVHRKLVPDVHQSLICDLQQTHDSGDGPEAWERKWQATAKQYNLQFTPL